jgi:hypothetical protein
MTQLKSTKGLDKPCRNSVPNTVCSCCYCVPRTASLQVLAFSVSKTRISRSVKSTVSAKRPRLAGCNKVAQYKWWSQCWLCWTHSGWQTDTTDQLQQHIHTCHSLLTVSKRHCLFLSATNNKVSTLQWRITMWRSVADRCSTASCETEWLHMNSTGSGTLGVIKCAELHASCATNSVERWPLLCAVTSFKQTDLGTLLVNWSGS